MYSICVTLLNRGFVLIWTFVYVGHFTVWDTLYVLWNISVVECLDDERWCILVFWVATLHGSGSCLSTFWSWIIPWTSDSPAVTAQVALNLQPLKMVAVRFYETLGDHLSFHLVSTQENAAFNQSACKSYTFKENWKSFGVQRIVRV